MKTKLFKNLIEKCIKKKFTKEFLYACHVPHLKFGVCTTLHTGSKDRWALISVAGKARERREEKKDIKP